MFTHRNLYRPEAPAAALEELKCRNTAPEELPCLEEPSESHPTPEDARAQEPLAWPLRILVFILCAGIPGGILGAYYETKGYPRKARDCWIIAFVSFMVHLLAGGCFYR